MTTVTERAANWRSAGACLDADPDLFFPISQTGPGRADIAQAMAICAGCQVRRQCLDFAQEHDLGYGIWGGTTPEDRRRVRRRERRPAGGRPDRPSRTGQNRRPPAVPLAARKITDIHLPNLE